MATRVRADQVSLSTAIQVASVNPPCLWQEVGTIGAAITAPAETARAVAVVDALAYAVVLDAPSWATTMMLRFQVGADADASTVIYHCAPGIYSLDKIGTTRGERYQYAGSMVLTGGKQTGPNSNVYVDTIVATNKTLTATALDSTGDHIACVSIPLLGMKHFCFQATVWATTIYVEARWY